MGVVGGLGYLAAHLYAGYRAHRRWAEAPGAVRFPSEAQPPTQEQGPPADR